MYFPYFLLLMSIVLVHGEETIERSNNSINIQTNNMDIGIDVRKVNKRDLFRFNPLFLPYRNETLYPGLTDNLINTDIRISKSGFVNTPGLSTTIDVDDPNHWSFEDQSHWKDKFPNCGGNFQSPIDIRTSEAQTVTVAIKCLTWKYYRSNQKYLTLKNTGHTIDASSTWNSNNIPILEGGLLSSSYKLEAVHWHWGSVDTQGSDHSFDGVNSPLEMHLVHYDTKHASITEALASANPEALVVVAILFQVASIPNAGMYMLINSMVKAKRQGRQNKILPLGSLGLNFEDDYYTYLGSLTTPPCNEVVRFLVKKTKLNITPKQLRVFRNIMVNGKKLQNNYREKQPLKTRSVLYIKKCTN